MRVPGEQRESAGRPPTTLRAQEEAQVRRHRKTGQNSLKQRGITPGKITKGNRHGQASGGWTPFGTSSVETKRMAPVDDVEYDAYDRARGRWFTNRRKD